MKPFDYNKYLRNNPLLKEAKLVETTIKDLFGPLAAKLESMGYEAEIDPTRYKTMFARKVLPDRSTLTVFIGPSEYELKKRDGEGWDDFETIDVTIRHFTDQVTKKFFGLYKSKERVGQQISDDAEGKNIDLGRGMFDIPVEDAVNRVVSLVQKAEAKVAGTINESMDDKIEANGDLFINNPSLKSYITDNDQYGFAIMEVPVDDLEAAMNMNIKDILAMDTGKLSISLDPETNTVDIILDRMYDDYEQNNYGGITAIKSTGRVREEKVKHWDFSVYDIDGTPVINKIKTAALKAGIKTSFWSGGTGSTNIAISPNNDKTFMVVFKILEKLGLEFDESRGMFSEDFKNVLKEWDPEDSDIIIPNQSQNDKNFFNKIVVPLLNKTLRSSEDGPDVFGKYKPAAKRVNWNYEEYGDQILININKELDDIDVDPEALQLKINKLYSQNIKK